MEVNHQNIHFPSLPCLMRQCQSSVWKCIPSLQPLQYAKQLQTDFHIQFLQMFVGISRQRGQTLQSLSTSAFYFRDLYYILCEHLVLCIPFPSVLCYFFHFCFLLSLCTRLGRLLSGLLCEAVHPFLDFYVI